MIALTISATDKKPLYEQIYLQIRQGIFSYHLHSGEKLPSSRVLSAQLGISRNTVNTAYEQLLAEGFLEARPKSGYYISDIFPEKTISFESFPDTSSLQDITDSEDSTKESDQKICIDFSPFAVDISHFPHTVWKKLSRRSLDEEKELFLLGDPFGDFPLRKAIANYLKLSRNVHCHVNQIIVGAGVDYLLQMLCLLFRHLGIRQITMEDPGYTRAAYVFKNNDLSVSPAVLDHKGLCVNCIDDQSQVVYVTPSHQYPLGIIMPIGRRKELLSWASSEFSFSPQKGEEQIACSLKRYIIEDDHDSEFRYKGRPIPSLQGIDEHDSVIYIGTFSNSIAPAIRAGYMVLPLDLLSAYQKICGHFSCTVSRLEQAILTRFIAEGYFEKHVNRMRKIYRAKHDLVLQELQPLVKNGYLQILGEHAGLHIVLSFPASEQYTLTEETIISEAKQAGICLYGLKQHILSTVIWINEKQKKAEELLPSAILLGYSNLSVEEIKTGMQLLKELPCFSQKRV